MAILLSVYSPVIERQAPNPDIVMVIGSIDL